MYEVEIIVGTKMLLDDFGYGEKIVKENFLIEAKTFEEAFSKLRREYPTAEILLIKKRPDINW